MLKMHRKLILIMKGTNNEVTGLTQCGQQCTVYHLANPLK